MVPSPTPEDRALIAFEARRPRPVAKGPLPVRRRLTVRTRPVAPPTRAVDPSPLQVPLAPFDDAAVTRALTEEGFYLEKAKEFLVPGLARNLESCEIVFPTTAEFLTEPESLAEFLFQVGTDPLIFGRAYRDPTMRLTIGSREFYGSRPYNFEMSWLEEFLSRIESEGLREALPSRCSIRPVPVHYLAPPRPGSPSESPSYSAKFRVAAFLVTRGITSASQLEMVLPAFRFREFRRYQSQVHAELRKRLPAVVGRFKAFWGSLTPPQQEALAEKYMAPGTLDSKPVVAARLGISLHSLNDRLNGALKKFKTAFPEWTPVRRRSFAPRRTRGNRLYDGLYSRDEARPVPFRQFDPKTNTWSLRQPTIAPKLVTEQAGFAEHLAWVALTIAEPYYESYLPLTNPQSDPD